MKHWNCCFITLKYHLKATNPPGSGAVHSGMKLFMTTLICPCGTRPAQRFGRVRPRHSSVEKSYYFTLKNSTPTLKSLKLLHIFCLTAANSDLKVIAVGRFVCVVLFFEVQRKWLNNVCCFYFYTITVKMWKSNWVVQAEATLRLIDSLTVWAGLQVSIGANTSHSAIGIVTVCTL